MLGRFLCHQFKNCNITTLGLDSNNNIVCDLANIQPTFYSTFSMVVHAAGVTNEANAVSVNYNGTVNLCNSLSQTPPQHFVYISSVQVYGCSQGQDFDETTPTYPITQYGISKLKAEQYLQQWCARHNVVLTILRPALIMGTGMKGTLKSMVKSISNGYYFHIKGNDAHRSIVHAIDVAKAAHLLAPIGGIYNLTDNIHPSVHDLAEAIASRIGGKRIYTLPSWAINMVAHIGDILGKLVPLNTKRLSQLTSTLTFDSSLISRTIDWKPLNVTHYLQHHQYTDQDI